MSDEELKTLFDAMRGETTPRTRRRALQVEATAGETRRYFDVVGQACVELDER